jgi:hypothetical protein
LPSHFLTCLKKQNVALPHRFVSLKRSWFLYFNHPLWFRLRFLSSLTSSSSFHSFAIMMISRSLLIMINSCACFNFILQILLQASKGNEQNEKICSPLFFFLYSWFLLLFWFTFLSSLSWFVTKYGESTRMKPNQRDNKKQWTSVRGVREGKSRKSKYEMWSFQDTTCIQTFALFSRFHSHTNTTDHDNYCWFRCIRIHMCTWSRRRSRRRRKCVWVRGRVSVNEENNC